MLLSECCQSITYYIFCVIIINVFIFKQCFNDEAGEGGANFNYLIYCRRSETIFYKLIKCFVFKIVISSTSTSELYEGTVFDECMHT